MDSRLDQDSSHRTTTLVVARCLIFLVLVFARPNTSSAATAHLHFNHLVGLRTMHLNSTNYTNAQDQVFTLTRFRYYISNIKFITTSGDTIAHLGYYLIDEDDNSSKSIHIPSLPSNTYRSVEFMIGVDSVHNCSGLQQGALDPVNGMFWAWNTGYIFLKLEGKSTSSAAPGGMLEYHIGGFREPDDCIVTTRLAFTEPLTMRDSSVLDIDLNVDALKILTGPTQVDFHTLFSVTDRHNAMLIARNYQHMITLSAAKLR